MRRALGLTLLMLLAPIGACGPSSPAPAPQREPEPTTSGTEAPPPVAEEAPPRRLPSAITPTRYTLRLEIDPRQERFRGVADIDVRISEATSRIWIHGQSLAVSAVRVTPAGGEAISATWREVDTSDGISRITLASPIGVGAARIHVEYEAPFDGSLEGLYRVEAAGDHYAFTQFEAIAARKAFPCFDEPRWKTPYDVTLVAPSGMRAFANSRETGTEAQGERVTTTFATTAALPTYLVAWAVGPLDVVEATIAPNDVRQRPLALRGIAARGRGPELAYAMEHTPRILAALEAWFGTPYPFDKLDIVAVPDFAAGAM